MVHDPVGRLLPFERRQGDMTLADAGDIAVVGSRRHVDIADDTIADAAVEVAFLSDDIVVNLDRLGHDADVVQADSPGSLTLNS